MAAQDQSLTLEDHLGDILRKARKAAHLPAAEAARAAGLGESEFSVLEASGQFSQRPDFSALAPLLGLQAKKLEAIADGWRPAPVDLSRWRELRRVTTTRAGNTVHCYLAWDEVSREAALFDTGWDAAPVFSLLEEQGVQLKHLFLTHTHEDHVAALADVRERFPNIRLHTNNKSAPPQHRNRANDCLQLGSLRITNRDTPGHADDGVIYLVGNWPDDAPHVAIIGDTIFAGSLATGLISTEMLRKNVLEKIFTLPPETLLGPGHGPWTTVAEEKAHNPFF
jgi:glyoxylase-like metal-dependent hydrolase (beta-lactamase superfamily II)